ncbi:MAG: helix-turn-helix domain-containing protein [Pseudomonadota bacterium]
MLDTIAALRLLAASQLFFWIGAMVLSANPLRTRVLGVALGLGIVAYLAIPLLVGRFDPAAVQVAARAADAIPALVLLFVWDLFEDDTAPVWVWSAAVVYLIIASVAALEWNPQAAPGATALALLVQLTKLAFVSLAILMIWRGRRYDLLEERLRLRRGAVALLGIIALVVVFVELVTGWRVPQTIELIGMATILSAALAVNLAFLKLNPTFALFPSPNRTTPATAPPDPVLKQLHAVMHDERLFTRHDLRISHVADRLQVPEYRLRRSINQGLGYRNFNQFINEYRVKEAAAKLRDGTRTPVLTIAIDAGFRSMSSFNSAFRDRFGLSPGEYRRSAAPTDS